MLDYSVNVIDLAAEDFILDYGELGNFSVAGFEMILERHISHYLITYYLPSGECACCQLYRDDKIWIWNDLEHSYTKHHY